LAECVERVPQMSDSENQAEVKPALEWLSERYPESPRKRLKEWFAKGRIQFDGVVLKKPHEPMSNPGERLSMGESAPVVFFRNMPTRIHAQANLLYIDSSLAIVNKSAGLLSVPVPGSQEISVLSVLEKFLQGKGADELDRQRGVQRKRLIPLPVHRLDQYTSGIICFAMNPQAREQLIKQVRDHTFLREYLAIGDGKLEKKSGEWRSWFRLDEEGMYQTVFDTEQEGSTEAISQYEVVEEYSWPTAVKGQRHTISKLRLRLETGLKHQLRIHAANAGVPLLGDRHYHPDFKAALEGKKGMPYGVERQALHASSLGLLHPVTGKLRRFNCKFTRDLADLEAMLQAKSKGQ
jgi:23S rRNA pseudouridine1911/1915/1917 synthase